MSKKTESPLCRRQNACVPAIVVAVLSDATNKNTTNNNNTVGPAYSSNIGYSDMPLISDKLKMTVTNYYITYHHTTSIGCIDMPVTVAFFTGTKNVCICIYVCICTYMSCRKF